MSKRQKYSDAVVPRRPRNAYNIFFAAERERLMQEAQNEEGGVDAVSTLAAATAEPTSKKKRNQACFANMARSMSHRWKTLNATEKQKYFALAQEEQQKYHAAMNACFNATEEEDDKKVAATASAAAATNASSSLVPPPSVPLDGGSWTSLLSTVNSPRHLPKNEKKITDPADLFQRKKPPPPLVDLSPKTSTLLEDRMLWLNRGDQQLQAGGGGFLPTQFQPLSVQETHKQQDRHFEDRSEEESKMNSSYRLPLLATDAPSRRTSDNSTSGSRMDLRQAARMASAAAVLASSSASMSVQHPSSDLPHSAHTSSEASSLPHASEFGWANTKKETAVAPSQHDQSRVATMSQDSAATLLHLSQQFLESSTTNLHEDLAGHDQEYQKHLLLPPPPAHQQQAPPSSSLSFPQDHDFVSRNEEVCWRNDLDVFTPTIHNARSSKGAPSSRSTGFGATPADLAVSLGSEAVEFLIDTFRSNAEEKYSIGFGDSGGPVLLPQTAVYGRREEENTAASSRRITDRQQHDRSLWDF